MGELEIVLESRKCELAKLEDYTFLKVFQFFDKSGLGSINKMELEEALD
jgi:Ca2+-binding EF-hand superfamily protein